MKKQQNLQDYREAIENSESVVSSNIDSQSTEGVCSPQRIETPSETENPLDDIFFNILFQLHSEPSLTKK